MYNIKTSNGTIIRTDQVSVSQGMEHSFPSVDCGDVEVIDNQGMSHHLVGKDSIPWDRIDTIVDFINEAAIEPALDTRVPDVARRWIMRVNDNGKPVRTQTELAQIIGAMDRLQDELKHVLVNFDWDDFPAVNPDEFELKVYHDSIDDEGVIAPEDEAEDFDDETDLDKLPVKEAEKDPIFVAERAGIRVEYMGGTKWQVCYTVIGIGFGVEHDPEQFPEMTPIQIAEVLLKRAIKYAEKEI